MNDKETTLTVNFDGETRSFRGTEELGYWIENEFSVWSKFAESAKPNVSPVYGRDKQRAHAKSFRSQLSQISAAKEETERENRLKNLVADIETKCSLPKDRYIPSDLPRGQHVLELAEDHEQVDLAVATLSYFIGTPIPQQNITSVSVSGLLEGAMFDKGASSNVESERRALRKLRADWDARFKENNQTNKSTLADAKEIKGKLIKFQEEEKAAFNTALIAARDRLQELQEIFFKKIQVDASKSYWASRARASRISFALWMVLLGTFAAAFASLFTGLVDKALQSGATGEGALLQYGSILVFAIIGIGGFRLIAKMMVSALHVNHEASERVTMIQTYLAFLAENSAVAEEERSLILPTLFRPGSTGLLADEPKTELPVETIMKLLMTRK